MVSIVVQLIKQNVSIADSNIKTIEISWTQFSSLEGKIGKTAVMHQ
jgi:hypothetical protein